MMISTFTTWADDKQLSASSRTVYAAMWNKLDAELSRRGIAIESASLEAIADAIESFTVGQDAREISSSVKRRYAQMVSRVLNSHLELPLRYKDRVREAPPSIDTYHTIAIIESMKTSSWKNKRDRALLAVMAFAGLKPGEAIALRPADLRRIGEVYHVSVTGSRARSVPANSAATRYIDEFIAVRSRMDLTLITDKKDDYFFLAKPAGGMLNASTVWRRVGELMDKANVQQPRAGGSLLRHGFGYRQVSASKDVRAIKKWMGFQHEDSVDVYLNSGPA